VPRTGLAEMHSMFDPDNRFAAATNAVFAQPR
jgi:hypothetical protein